MMYVDDVMLVIGVGLLAAALLTVRSIIRLLSASSTLRRQWIGLSALIVFFIVGYVGLVFLWEERALVANELVALILMVAGAFTLVVTRLSFVTTNDVVRIAKLERDAIEDPLTGTYNRRYLDSKLIEEVSRATRLNLPLSAVLIDLDHFKHVNDTYGHDVGDLVLRHVCSLIIASVRPNDTVFRYGGEEFVVIAPNCDIDAAATLGERMRLRIAESVLSLPGGQDLAVTASLGISSLSLTGSSEAMLRAADQALYTAKRGGRNRTCAAPADISETPAA
ncbi:diguanylate cyclase (GGDEF)-like protein [Devosia sp. UYZn731]|uniref:GGDEF domain-containing protein n=1 Tax=Devosia sp. UYZn731 TaxID=3156345 RepID=UPI003391E87C